MSEGHKEIPTDRLMEEIEKANDLGLLGAASRIKDEIDMRSEVESAEERSVIRDIKIRTGEDSFRKIREKYKEEIAKRLSGIEKEEE